jgi:thiol-disulfide isomerase/thioredoxin
MGVRTRGLLIGVGIALAASAVTLGVLSATADSKNDVQKICVAEDCPTPTDLPTTELLLFNGEETTTLPQLLAESGRPIVVNFWSASCVPCRKEMPTFENVFQARRNDVDFIGVNIEDEADIGEAFAAETGVSFQLVRDPRSEAFAAIKGRGMPTTLLVTEDGRIIEQHTGELSAEKLSEKIDALLAAG